MILNEKFEVHDKLNPKLWNNKNELLPEVHDKIIEIVDAFQKYIQIPIYISDIYLIGSNASYNYTATSDIDVHIITNYELVDVDSTIIGLVYDTMRSKFNKEFDITIKGLEVELFVEDVKTNAISNGIYSILQNKWIKFPVKLDNIKEYDIAKEVEFWTNKANQALSSNNKEELEKVVSNIYLMRKNWLATEGEFSKGNQIFKELRNLGIISTLKDAIKNATSKELSLEHLTESLLKEDSVQQLLSRSRSTEDGAKRYKDRIKSKIRNTPKQYNQIDMNKLFKDGILTVDVEVQGETSSYIVRISFGGFLDILHDQTKKLTDNQEVDLKAITKTLITGFNRGDVYIHCDCCLKGDTQIKLLNGQVVTIENMYERFQNGEKFFVYSTDEAGDFKPGEVSNVFISKYVHEMIKVTLDNGEVIETTPDHPYMLRNGTYKPAEELVVGQSLMPMYFKYQNGYENYKKNSITNATKFYSVYKEVANTLLQNEIEKAKIRSGEDIISIHHSDFNKLNNYPDNLKPMGFLEHYNYHSNHVKESGCLEKFIAGGQAHNALVADHSTEEYKKQAEIFRKAMNDYYSNLSEEEKVKISDRLSKKSKNAWKRGCFDTIAFKQAAHERGEFLRSKEIEDLAAEGVRKYWENISPEEKAKRDEICRKNILHAQEAVKGVKFTEEHKNKISEYRKNETPEESALHNKKIQMTKVKNILIKCLDLGLDLTTENYEEVRKSYFHIGYPKVTSVFDSIETATNYFQLNHKVVKIEHVYYDEAIPVYDITVPNYSNFLVNAGVILHNCDFKYRYNYWTTRKGLNSGTPETRPSNITNPDNDMGSGCKHVLLVLTNSSWILKSSVVIFNYIQYMKKHQEKLYKSILYPAIYDKEYEEPVEEPTEENNINN